VLLSIQVWLVDPTKAGSPCAFGNLRRKSARTVSKAWSSSADHDVLGAQRRFRPNLENHVDFASRRLGLAMAAQHRAYACVTLLARLNWGAAGATGTLERESLECFSILPPPGRVHLSIDGIPASIDQATRPVAASPFVIATRAGGAQPSPRKAPDVR
jgi:hypothetical protein